MSQRALLDRNIRKITKLGKFSYGITLPIDVMKKWSWHERQKVILDIDDKKKQILVKDWK